MGVSGDSIQILRGDVNKIQASRVIDATNMVVCPGFIDLHSHTALTIFGDPEHKPKVFQGVTTEMVGIDGISPVPFKNKEELERYIWLDSGLNDYYPGIPDWLKTFEYLNKLDLSLIHI